MEDCLRHVCPSIRMEQLCSHLKNFHEIWYLRNFFEILLRNFKFRYNRLRITGNWNVDRYKFSIISPSVLLRMKMFHTNVVQQIETHGLCSKFFLKNLCHLWDNLEKCFIWWQDTDVNMAGAHCVLST
jgi:hypothetical protein